MDTVRLIGSVLIFLSTGEAILFVAIYSIKTAWWRSVLGRHLAAFVGTLGLVLFLAGIHIVASGETLWFAWVRVGVFSAIPVLLGQRIWLLIQAQRAERRAQRMDAGDDDAPTE